MIKKTARKIKLQDTSQINKDLNYWLNLPSQERLAAVELLRRQIYGHPKRLQRTARVVHRQQS